MKKQKTIRSTLIVAQTAVVILCVLASWSLFAEEKRYDIPVGDTPYRGSAVAAVTIVEFIDFQ